MNLRDRMKSGSHVSEMKEQEQMKSLSDTMPSLSQQHQDSILQKQSETIQTLSSEILMLKKKLQEKSEMIVSLNDRIGTLSSADLILKENKLLEQSNKDLQRKEQATRKEAEATISAVKNNYHQKERKLQSAIKAANVREMEAEKQIKEESSRINSLADSKIAVLKDHLMKEYHTNMEEQQYNYTQRMRKLETEYRVKSNSLHSLIIGSSLYGLFVTLLTALKSPRCCQDIEEAYTFIYDFFSDILEKSIILALYGWSIKESIPYDVINVLVPGLLAVLGFIFLPAILLLVLFGIYKLGKIYKENFADLISVLVALASLAVLVWFADQLSFISWNLVIVFLLIHLMYLIVRILLDSNDCF